MNSNQVVIEYVLPPRNLRYRIPFVWKTLPQRISGSSLKTDNIQSRQGNECLALERCLSYTSQSILCPSLAPFASIALCNFTPSRKISSRILVGSSAGEVCERNIRGMNHSPLAPQLVLYLQLIITLLYCPCVSSHSSHPWPAPLLVLVTTCWDGPDHHPWGVWTQVTFLFGSKWNPLLSHGCYTCLLK